MVGEGIRNQWTKEYAARNPFLAQKKTETPSESDLQTASKPSPAAVLTVAPSTEGMPASEPFQAPAYDRMRFLNPESATGSVMTNGERAVQQEIDAMAAWEKLVVAHERMHMLIGGGMASTPAYTYKAGPDGKRYITGGEVQFNVPATSDPMAVIRNLGRVKAAALSPGNASAADMTSAGLAAAREAQALREYNRIQSEHKQASSASREADATHPAKGSPVPEQNDGNEPRFREHIDILIDKARGSALSRMQFRTMSLFDMMI